MSFKLHITYFALLREQRGLSTEELHTSHPTARDLYEELQARYGFSLPAERVRVAVNDEFSPWEIALREGQRIVFIPPVAGG